MSNFKPVCSFGESCYRLQEKHFSDYRHPHLDLLLNQIKSDDIEIPATYIPKVSEDTLMSQLNIVKWLKISCNLSSSAVKNEINESSSTADSSKQSSSKINTASVKRGLNDYMSYVRKRCKGDVLQKLEYSEPYRFFLSSIAAEPKTHDEMHTLSFPELLNEKLGILESSLQINFMVQIDWLLAQYAVNNEKSTPITLLYGCEDSELTELLEKKLLPNVTATYVKPSAFGSHHTKMMILSYRDESIRVIITTGNLIEMEWENTTQGLWVSPRLPPIIAKSENESTYDSETNFKRDLLYYLESYKLPVLQPWIDKVTNADFTKVKVFFVASIPGNHLKNTTINWGLYKISDLLSKYAIIPSENAKDWPLYCQCSSIGSQGKNPYSWFLGEFTRAMISGMNWYYQPPVKLIYPSFEDIAASHDGLLAGGSFPYTKSGHDKQPWICNYMCKWRSNARYRTRAMPHIKTYCRLSPCEKYLSWFLLTSANLSKAGWGMENKAKSNLRILNYEVGVLFLPSVLISKNQLPLVNENSTKDGAQFPLPYDLPLTPYTSNDIPWFIDMLQNS